MELLFLHWGLHGWGVFALVAMALAYFAYRHNLPLALRSALYPLIGKRINGPIGYTVDCFGIIATVFGLGADMGFGVLQLNSGLDYLYAIPHTHPVQMALIVLMMGAAISVAVSGVDKGIRILSDINMLLACSLLLFVLFAGPTQHLLNTLVQNVGDYLGHLPGKSFDLYAYGGPSDWLGSWTVFYWAWWIAWAPFVGLFIARISRGRTIREFVFGVLFIPLGFTLAWMSIFGNSALEQALGGASELGRVAIEQPSMALYQMLQNYPWSRAVITVTVLVSFVFFVTSADSGTVVLSTLSAHGGSADDDGPKWLRVFWGSVTALVTGGLLFAGSIDALKSAVVLTSLPFSLILLLMMWGLHKAFYMESQRQRARSHSPGAADERQRQALRRLEATPVAGRALPLAGRGVPLHERRGAPGDQRGFRGVPREGPGGGRPARPGQRLAEPGDRSWRAASVPLPGADARLLHAVLRACRHGRPAPEEPPLLPCRGASRRR